MDPSDDFLLTDLYQLAMMEAYVANGETGNGRFRILRAQAAAAARGLPDGRAGTGSFLSRRLARVAGRSGVAGAQLAIRGRFTRLSLAVPFHGRRARHAGKHRLFPDEPIIRITAPLPEAQYVESRIVNILQFRTMIASRAARMVFAAEGRQLVDFGLRRAHGAEAGLLAARAAHVAGFTGTATVLAGQRFGVPIHGAMAHSYIQAHETEEEAFLRFARARPDNLVLLTDTYDTLAGAEKVVRLAPRLKSEGITVTAVRLDSGISARSRAASAACSIRREEYRALARRKLSTGKATWPGRKQVWRRYDKDGRMIGDVLSLEDDRQDGEPLIECLMREQGACRSR